MKTIQIQAPQEIENKQKTNLSDIQTESNFLIEELYSGDKGMHF